MRCSRSEKEEGEQLKRQHLFLELYTASSGRSRRTSALYQFFLKPLNRDILY